MVRIERISGFMSFDVAVSVDRKLIATSSERKVRILSYPDCKLIASVQVPTYPTGLAFCEDDRSLLIAISTGAIYLWTDGQLSLLGNWPERMFLEGRFYHCGHNFFALAHFDGISLFDLTTRTFRDLYRSEDCFANISGIEDGIVHFATSGFTPRWQQYRIHSFDLRTGIRCECTTDRQLDTARTSPFILLHDGSTAFISKVRDDDPLRSSVRLFRCEKDGRTIEEAYLPQEYLPVRQDPLYASSAWVAVEESGERHRLLLFHQQDFSRTETIDADPLEPKLLVNPISDVRFISDDEFLLGTWNSLYRCKISE